ncbi:MAG TPA: hypothetical protein VL092_06155 [Chitinophagaceae bacterium]|nr:hypothetical protein [Chitinophagaceae bacterium]
MTACLPVTQAQRNVVKFDPAHCDSFTHGFRKVIVLDQRPDTFGIIGYVNLGLRGPEKVEIDGSLSEKVVAYYQALSEKAASPSGKDLIVVIHDLMVTEDKMGFMKEFAFFRYRAEYFTGNDEYTSLGMIDTTIQVSAGDVTAKLLRKVDESLCTFCQILLDNARGKIADTVYTLDDIRMLETFRRMKMPAYTAKVYPDGIYSNWPDFLQLKYLEGKKLLEYRKKRFVAQSINKKGKPYTFGVVPYNPDKPIDPGRIIVFQGIPYKAFEGKFYPMRFSSDSNFHFTAQTDRYNPIMRGGYSPMMAGGGLGAGVGFAFFIPLNGRGRLEEYDFAINWRSGNVVPGRQLNGKAKKRR